MKEEPAYPYEAWISHYALGICRVTILGRDWYREKEYSDEWPVLTRVYARFADGLITDVTDAENDVFATESDALEKAIRSEKYWLNRETTERITKREQRILEYSERLTFLNLEK